MTREQQLADIRQKCIAANPEIKLHGCTRFWCGDNGCGKADQPDRPIRLADVLLAIPWSEYSFPWVTDANAKIKDIMTAETVDRWNLRADDLSQQSDETISFVYEITK